MTKELWDDLNLEDGDTGRREGADRTWRNAHYDAPETVHVGEDGGLVGQNELGGTEAWDKLRYFADKAGGVDVEPTGKTGHYGREIVGLKGKDGSDIEQDMLASGLVHPSYEEHAENGANPYVQSGKWANNRLHSDVNAEDEGDAELLAQQEALWQQREQGGDSSDLSKYGAAGQERGIYGYRAQPFGDAIRRGIDNTQASGFGLVAALGEATGVELAQEWGEEGLVKNVQEAMLAPAQLESWDDVDGLADTWTFFIEAVGEQVPQLAADAAAFVAGTASSGVGGFGMVSARRAAQATAMKALKDRLGGPATEALMREVTKKAGKEIGMKYGKRAAMAGIYTQVAGETALGLQQDGVEDYGTTALLTGVPKAAAEYFGLNTLAGGIVRAIKPGAAGTISKAALHVAGRLGIAAGTEGITEGMQTVMDFMAGRYHDSETDFLDPLSDAEMSELRTAVAKGAMVSGGLGTVGEMGGGLTYAHRRIMAHNPAPAAEPQDTPDTDRAAEVQATVDENTEVLNHTAPSAVPGSRTEAQVAADQAGAQTNPEPMGDINAQMKDLANAKSIRDSIYLSSTQSPEEVQTLHNQMREEKIKFFKVKDPEGGHLFTTNRDKAQAYKKNPTEKTRQDALNIKTAKEDLTQPIGIQKVDKEGNISREEAINFSDRVEMIAAFERDAVDGEIVRTVSIEELMEKRDAAGQRREPNAVGGNEGSNQGTAIGPDGFPEPEARPPVKRASKGFYQDLFKAVPAARTDAASLVKIIDLAAQKGNPNAISILDRAAPIMEEGEHGTLRNDAIQQVVEEDVQAASQPDYSDASTGRVSEEDKGQDPRAVTIEDDGEFSLDEQFSGAVNVTDPEARDKRDEQSVLDFAHNAHDVWSAEDADEMLRAAQDAFPTFDFFLKKNKLQGDSEGKVVYKLWVTDSGLKEFNTKEGVIAEIDRLQAQYPEMMFTASTQERVRRGEEMAAWKPGMPAKIEKHVIHSEAVPRELRADPVDESAKLRKIWPKLIDGGRAAAFNKDFNNTTLGILPTGREYVLHSPTITELGASLDHSPRKSENAKFRHLENYRLGLVAIQDKFPGMEFPNLDDDVKNISNSIIKQDMGGAEKALAYKREQATKNERGLSPEERDAAIATVEDQGVEAEAAEAAVDAAIESRLGATVEDQGATVEDQGVEAEAAAAAVDAIIESRRDEAIANDGRAFEEQHYESDARHAGVEDIEAAADKAKAEIDRSPRVYDEDGVATIGDTRTAEGQARKQSYEDGMMTLPLSDVPGRTMKVAVVGSRKFKDFANMKENMDNLAKSGDFTVLNGEANGADKMGGQWAKRNKMEVESHPALWKAEGKSAGYKRNTRMAKAADMVVAFRAPDSTTGKANNRGTDMMIKIAREKGLKVIVIEPGEVAPMPEAKAEDVTDVKLIRGPKGKRSTVTLSKPKASQPRESRGKKSNIRDFQNTLKLPPSKLSKPKKQAKRTPMPRPVVTPVPDVTPLWDKIQAEKKGEKPTPKRQEVAEAHRVLPEDERPPVTEPVWPAVRKPKTKKPALKKSIITEIDEYEQFMAQQEAAEAKEPAAKKPEAKKPAAKKPAAKKKKNIEDTTKEEDEAQYKEISPEVHAQRKAFIDARNAEANRRTRGVEAYSMGDLQDIADDQRELKKAAKRKTFSTDGVQFHIGEGFGPNLSKFVEAVLRSSKNARPTIVLSLDFDKFKKDQAYRESKLAEHPGFREAMPYILRTSDSYRGLHMRVNGNESLIFVAPQKNQALELMALTHELGHSMYVNVLGTLQENRGSHQHKVMRAAFLAERDGLPQGVRAKHQWWQENEDAAFEEWFADKYANWAVKQGVQNQNKNPGRTQYDRIAHQIFSKIRAALQKIMKQWSLLPKAWQFRFQNNDGFNDAFKELLPLIRNNAAYANSEKKYSINDGVLSEAKALKIPDQVTKVYESIPKGVRTRMRITSKHGKNFLKGLHRATQPFWTADAQLKNMEVLVSDRAGETATRPSAFAALLASMFYNVPGAKKLFKGQSFFEGTNQRRGEWGAAFTALTKDFADVQAVLTEVEALGENADPATLSPDAKKVHQFLEQFYTGYLKKHNPTLGKIKNYFPTYYVPAHAKNNPNRLRAILVKHGFKPKAANDVALTLAGLDELNTYRQDSPLMSDRVSEPGMNSRHSRRLRDPALRKELREHGYISEDREDAISHYIHQSVRSSESQRVFSTYSNLVTDPAKSASATPVHYDRLVRDAAAEKSTKKESPVQEKGRHERTWGLVQALNAVIDKHRLPPTYIHKANYYDEHGGGSASYMLEQFDKLIADGYVKLAEGDSQQLVQYDPDGLLTNLLGSIKEENPANGRRAHEIVKGYTGQLGQDLPHNVRNSMAWVQIYQNLTTLLFSAVASLPDLGGTLLRTRDVKMSGKAFLNNMKAMRDGAKAVAGDTSPTNLYNQARLLGLIDQRVSHDAINQLYGQNFMGEKQKKFNEAFFKINGQEMLTNFTRVAAAATAEDFILHHGPASANNSRSLRYLQELGINSADVATFVANGKQKWTPDQESSAADNTQKIQRAINQFVDESVMRPNAAQRPLWASDPRFMLLWHLKSFFYAFHNTITKQIYNETKTRLDAGEITGAAVMPLMTAAYLLPLAAMGLTLRHAVQYELAGEEPPEEEGLDYVWELVERAGLMGPMSMAYGVGTAGENQQADRAVGLLGPSLQHLFFMFSAEESSNASAAEKRLKRSLPVAGQLHGFWK